MDQKQPGTPAMLELPPSALVDRKSKHPIHRLRAQKDALIAIDFDRLLQALRLKESDGQVGWTVVVLDLS